MQILVCSLPTISPGSLIEMWTPCAESPSAVSLLPGGKPYPWESTRPGIKQQESKSAQFDLVGCAGSGVGLLLSCSEIVKEDNILTVY